MPASLFCNCMRCCRSAARHAFSPPADLRTCRNPLACTTNNAATATITKRAMMDVAFLSFLFQVVLR